MTPATATRTKARFALRFVHLSRGFAWMVFDRQREEFLHDGKRELTFASDTDARNLVREIHGADATFELVGGAP